MWCYRRLLKSSMDTGQIIKQTTNEWLLTRLKAEKTLLAQTNGRATFNTWLGGGAEQDQTSVIYQQPASVAGCSIGVGIWSNILSKQWQEAELNEWQWCIVMRELCQSWDNITSSTIIQTCHTINVIITSHCILPRTQRSVSVGNDPPEWCVTEILYR